MHQYIEPEQQDQQRHSVDSFRGGVDKGSVSDVGSGGESGCFFFDKLERGLGVFLSPGMSRGGCESGISSTAIDSGFCARRWRRGGCRGVGECVRWRFAL